MKVLIRHLKDVHLNRREDTLAALKVALQTWYLAEVTTEVVLKDETLLLGDTCSASPGHPFPFWARTVLLLETAFSSLLCLMELFFHPSSIT